MLKKYNEGIMLKKLVKTITSCLLVAIMLLIAGCDTHVHVYSNKGEPFLEGGKYYQQKICSCGDIKNEQLVDYEPEEPGDEPGDEPSDEPGDQPGAHQHDYASDGSPCFFEEDKLYQYVVCDCSADRVKQEITDYTSVNGQTLFDYLHTGEEDRILVLESDYYGFIELNSVESYDNNLTLIAKGSVNFEGLLITSGSSNVAANSVNDVMPSNLKLINIGFSLDVHVRNCSMDGITLYNCNFTDGARIYISSNSFSAEPYDMSYFGSDASVFPSARAEHQYNVIKNITIEKCSFSGEKNPNVYKDITKMIIFDVENITIKDNVIESAGYSAVQLNSQESDDSRPSFNGITGNIVIEGNQISNTKSRALRFNGVRSFSNITIKNNTLVNSVDEKGEAIKGSSMGTNISVIFSGNTLDGQALYNDGVKVKGLIFE